MTEDVAATFVKNASELVDASTKALSASTAAMQAVVAKEREGEERSKSSNTRSGPLQVVGQVLVAQTTVLAIASSVAAYFDHLADHHISWETHLLRILLAATVLVGLVGGLLLLGFLANRHHSLLFSPTELSANIQTAWMDKGENFQEPKVSESEGDDSNET